MDTTLNTTKHSETRWRAAWALGNAVKNDAASQLWLLEEVPPMPPATTTTAGAPTTTTTTALSQLVGALMEAKAAVAAAAAAQWGQHEEELLRKAVYALTAAARGNARVQGALREAGGLAAMSRLLLLSSAALQGEGGQGQQGRRRLSLRVKLAAFGHDLAVEAKGACGTCMRGDGGRGLRVFSSLSCMYLNVRA